MGRGKINKKFIFLLGGSFVISFALFFSVNNLIKQPKEVKGADASLKTYRALATPNDPLFSTQSNFRKVSAETAWNISTGDATTIVAVLDTGIVANHEDLVGKMVAGYDFIGDDTDTNPDPGGGTAAFHGTAVASLVASKTNNGVGMAGSCWNCKIMPIRVLDNDGSGDMGTVTTAVYWAVDNGAKVINMSFGAPHYSWVYDPDLRRDIKVDNNYDEMQTAIDYAAARGVVMVAAAGNNGDSSDITEREVNYPARYNHVLAVGSSDASDNRASSSCYGPELDLVAPGVGVQSAYSYWSSSSSNYVTNHYGWFEGTSLASPQVAGQAALLVSKTPSLSADQVAARIKTWTDKVPGMNGSSFTDFYGTGRANFYASLASNLTISSPQNGTTTSAASQIISGVTNPQTPVNIYLNSTKISTISSDINGAWSYQINNLTTGSYYLEAETTIADTTYRLGVTLVVDRTTKVYRFWNKNGTHFYTASEAEKNNIIAKWPGTFKYEGVAYGLNQVPQNNTSLYRFYNLKNNTHFYTASEAEKNNIVVRWASTYKLEGVSYYVSGSAGGTPVYRFWNANGTHFYTASEVEKNNVIARWPGTFKYEGVAYYIY